MADFNLEHLRQFRFKELFNELGWELPAQQQPYSVTVGEDDFALDVVAHKRGVQILHCRPDAKGYIPIYSLRQKIERKVTAEAREHLIVFTNAALDTQVWQWVSRAPGRPNQYREVPWRTGESTELLRQKLSVIAFTLDEEESLTVFGVAQRLTVGFDRDKVTKKFYGEFEKLRKAFAAFIAGIPNTGEDLRWYTAVLIDRLMFLWFLQEKGFLDGKKRYLQDHLAEHLAAQHGISFYRHFLCPLFFRGFAEERTDANRAAIRAAYGNVPYLNGGLFAQHELEQRHGAVLDVADTAFEKLFAFFSQWDWHLDDRPLASGREINPDVLGYIFEKFVNQKQMGAYYTKEDITEYIGKNTIIPCMLSKVRAEHPGAFDELAWPLLQQSGDAYIYPAMLKGVDVSYPTEIAAGIDPESPDLLEHRKPWNKRADDAVSLPTEIWRETIARHERTREVRTKITAGELRDVGDLITYNLNIRQFMQDLIESCTDVALLKSFWFALAGRLPRKSNEKFRHGLSVLDPTCGSGAFLFAALNILKPLYDACLRTLHAVRSDTLIAGEKSHPEKWAEVDEILTRFATAKSDRAQDYAVYKHIIVHNLYGVDIEEQATEIAKLRLFLKLVALLEPGDDIEPLPDIDFNIRHGNTLVGYATADETERAVKGATQGNLFSDGWEDIRIRLAAVEQQYNNFQIQQVQRGGHVSANDKQALTDTLHDLEETLNYHLAREYGVDPTKTKGYEAWKASHKPFHWYVDFYPLMAAGGFDAVIGNPPFVEIRPANVTYVLKNYSTAKCGNLYAPIIERCVILGANGWLGLITPLSLVCTDRTIDLRRIVVQYRSWISSYDMRPSSLFEHVAQRLCLLLCSVRTTKPSVFMGGYRRWASEERPGLLQTGGYAELSGGTVHAGSPWPKVVAPIEVAVLGRLKGPPMSVHESEGAPALYVHRIVRYFIKALDRAPLFIDASGVSGKSDDYKLLKIEPSATNAVLACLNSSLFYWHWRLTSDGFHCGYGDIYRFPFDATSVEPHVEDLRGLVGRLMGELSRNSSEKTITTKTGTIRYEEFYPKKSKPTVDEIDALLARAWCLSSVEQDLVVNYDIKYRMGQGVETGDD
jgi:hypothetical protein